MSKADELKAKNENLFERNTILLNENERLKKENEELRNNGFTVSAMTEQQLKVALEKGEQLEKENAELKEWQKDTIKARGNDYMDWSRMKDQLTKAKEIIREIMKYDIPTLDYVKAEQFLKEIEK